MNLATYMEGLDPYQAAVVAHVRDEDTDLRAAASAGSGKTHTLVAAVGVAIERYGAENVVVTTFTKKAAEELKARIKRVLGDAADAARIGTFHSLCYRALVAKDPSRWAMTRNLDGDTCPVRAAKLWDKILFWSKDGIPGLPGVPSLGLDNDDLTAKTYMSQVGLLRSNGIRPGTPAALEQARRVEAPHAHSGGVRVGLPAFGKAWAMYEQAKAATGYWDWDDALQAYDTQVSARPTGCFVIVDEAQDNNRVQLSIARALASRDLGGRLVLVGDSRQAIYGFRGAAPDVFIKSDMPTLSLPRNYRSGSEIVNLGARLVDGKPWAVGQAPEPVRDLAGEVVKAKTPILSQVLDHAFNEIGGQLEAGLVKPEDVAVLVRTNQEAGMAEGAALRRGVPVVRIGGRSFWSLKEPKAFYAYVVLSEIDNADALGQVYHSPKRYLGAAWLEAVKREARRGSLFAAMKQAASLRPGYRRGTDSLIADIQALRKLPWADRPAAIAEILLRNHKVDEGEVEAEPDEDDVRATLRVCVESAQAHESAVAFVAFAEQCSRQTLSGTEPVAGRVSILTGHRAKGLEWPSVYVVATSMPHRRGDPDEELRLFYVAVTRARDRLVLCASTLDLYSQPSQSYAFGLQVPAVTP